MLRSSWLKLTLPFEEHFWDKEMDTKCEVSKAWHRTCLLENDDEEESGSSFVANSKEEEVESNENDSCWDNAGSDGKANEFWELKLRISLPWWLWFVSIS